MCPDVDSLVVKLEDALEAVLILQPLSVSGVDGDLFVVVRDLLDTEQLEWESDVVTITAGSHCCITGTRFSTMLHVLLHAAVHYCTHQHCNMKRLKVDTSRDGPSHNWP